MPLDSADSPAECLDNTLENAPKLKKKRRRYKQSAWRCERCRKAHRRCVHPQSNQAAVESPSPVEQATSLQNGLVDGQLQRPVLLEPSIVDGNAASDACIAFLKKFNPAISAETLALPSLSVSLLSQPTESLSRTRPPAVATDDVLAEMLALLFSVLPLDAKFWRTTGKIMLASSSAFHSAVSAFYLLHTDVHVERALALEYIQAAVVGLRTQFYSEELKGQGTILCLCFLLSMCSFVSQEPMDRFLVHSTGSGSLVKDYLSRLPLPPLISGLISVGNIKPVITQEMLARHADMLAPLIKYFPEEDFCAPWIDGTLQDFVSVLMDAIALLDGSPDTPAVYKVTHRLQRYSVLCFTPPPDKQRLVSLILEGIYVLCMHLAYVTRLVPEQIYNHLCEELESAEACYGPVLFVQRVCERVKAKSAERLAVKTNA